MSYPPPGKTERGRASPRGRVRRNGGGHAGSVDAKARRTPSAGEPGYDLSVGLGGGGGGGGGASGAILAGGGDGGDDHDGGGAAAAAESRSYRRRRGLRR